MANHAHTWWSNGAHVNQLHGDGAYNSRLARSLMMLLLLLLLLLTPSMHANSVANGVNMHG